MRDEWIAAALIAAVVSATFSIAVSGIFQGVAFLLWGMRALRERRLGLETPPFFWFLAAFTAAVVVSLVFSHDPVNSLRYLPKTLKYLLVPLFFTFLSCSRAVQASALVIAGIVLSAALALVQYYWLLDVHLMNRIRGFMSHWMTFSGQVMMATIFLFAFLLLGKGPFPHWRWPRWAAGACLAITVWALLLTYTRNAWLGALVGCAIVLTLRNWRWLIPAGVLLLPLLLLFPAQFQDRVRAGFDLGDETVKGRLELLQVGGRMIAANPLTGVGPMMVPYVAEEYGGSSEFDPGLYMHLHNSGMQIAAELGLPALLIWLALWVHLLVGLRRRLRAHPRDSWPHWFSSAALAVLGGFLASSLLEYNFGDAELTILLLFFLTAPYLAERDAADFP